MTETSHEHMTAKGMATREKLLQAAAKAFAEFGYERTRIADIVQVAGVSHGNFYRHFADKDEILLAVLQPLLGEVHQASGRGPGEKPFPTEAELIERNAAFFRAYAKQRYLLRVMREAAAQTDKVKFLDLWLMERSKFINRTAAWLKTLQQQGYLAVGSKPQLLAEALGALTEQLAYVHIGLAKLPPRYEQIEELGRICGRIWYLSIFGDAPDFPNFTEARQESSTERTSAQ
jgi:AcrR family transcriptional regulator